jgi:predicted CoA-binding protein
MSTTMMDRARAFLALRRIAFVGLSRDPRDFSRLVFDELLKRGYDVVPVNPAPGEIAGRRAFARVSEIAPPVQGALLLTPPARSAEAVRDCIAAGVRELWLHRGAGAGSATLEALAAAREAGVEPVSGLCPFMALPDAGWLHRAHGFLRGAHRMPAGPTA